MTATEAAQAALRSTHTTALLRSAYTLSHKIHAEQDMARRARASGYYDLAHAAEDKVEDYRAQRDLIDAEILRRTGEGS